jgi:hypothetical protein
VRSASYEPSVVYVCIGFATLAVVPSPKSHAYVIVPSPPAAVPVKRTVSGAGPPDGDADAPAIGMLPVPTVIVTVSMPVSPSTSVTVSVAVYTPAER